MSVPRRDIVDGAGGTPYGSATRGPEKRDETDGGLIGASIDCAIRALQESVAAARDPNCPVCSPGGKQVVCCGEAIEHLTELRKRLPLLYSEWAGFTTDTYTDEGEDALSWIREAVR